MDPSRGPLPNRTEILIDLSWRVSLSGMKPYMIELTQIFVFVKKKTSGTRHGHIDQKEEALLGGPEGAINNHEYEEDRQGHDELQQHLPREDQR